MVERALHIRDLVDGDRATLAALLARAVVYGREDERTAILGAAI